MATHGAELIDNYKALCDSRGSVDLYQLDAIREIRCVLPEAPASGAILEIEAVWTRDSGQDEVIVLRFMGVRELELPKIGGQWFGFSELEVRDVSSNGLEGIRLQVNDYGDDGLRFACHSAAFIRVGEQNL